MGYFSTNSKRSKDSIGEGDGEGKDSIEVLKSGGKKMKGVSNMGKVHMEHYRSTSYRQLFHTPMEYSKMRTSHARALHSAQIRGSS